MLISTMLKTLLKKVFHIGLRPYTKNEREGVKLAFRFMLKHPTTLTIMLVTGLGAAIFEGGTLGILALAVSVLTGEGQNIPLEMPRIVDDEISLFLETTSRGGVFLTIVGIAVCAQILKGILLYVSTLAQINLAYGMQGAAQDQATHHVMRMKYGDVAKYPSGRLVSLVDQSGIVSNVVSEVGKASRAGLMVISYIGVMLFLSPILSLSSMLIFFLLFLSFNKLVRAIKSLSRESFWGTVDTARWAVEFIGAPRLLRVFGSGDKAEKIIKEARYRRIDSEKKSASLIAIIIPAFEIITVFGAGVFLVVGYLVAGESAIEVVPKLFVFVLVFFRLKPQVKLLNDLRVSIGKLLPQLEIIGEFLREKNNNFDRVGGNDYDGLVQEIVFKDVCLTYDDTENYAVKNLNFSINRGETVALVGESGAGKTTVINLLLELYNPSSGDIFVDGCRLGTINIEQWRDRIGIVDQDVVLLNTTIENNISFGQIDFGQNDIETVARIANAHEFISRLELGYQTVVGDRGYSLSGGQKQRIALARAIFRNPDILVLDEATSALDSLSENLVQKAIKNMSKSRTVLVVAHRFSTIESVDKIIVMDNGEIVESGTLDYLLGLKGKFATMWNLQTGLASTRSVN